MKAEVLRALLNILRKIEVVIMIYRDNLIYLVYLIKPKEFRFMHLLNVEKVNYEEEFDDIVEKSHKILSLIHKSSYSRQCLRGRKAADAPFWFALA